MTSLLICQASFGISSVLCRQNTMSWARASDRQISTVACVFICNREAAIHDFEIQLVRLCLGKAPLSKFDPVIHTGKMNAEKVVACRHAWVRYATKNDRRIVEASNYKFAAGSSGGDVVPDEDPSNTWLQHHTQLQ